MNDKITVCLGKGGQREMAESFARKNNVPIICLLYTSDAADD